MDCRRCGKPICSACSTESGMEGCCPACGKKPTQKDKATAAKSGPAVPPSPNSRTSRALHVGEVTVHADGTVETQDVSPVEESKPTTAGKPGETASRGSGVLDLEGRTKRGKGPEYTSGITRASPPAHEDDISLLGIINSSVSPASVPSEPSTGSVSESGAESLPEERSAKAGEKSTRGNSTAENTRTRTRVGKIVSSNRTLQQLYYALPFAFLAGVLIYAFWILLALLRRQWVQTSVLTAGIAVPWALYKGTTFRKRLGKPLYDNSPGAFYIASVSLVVMAILFVLAEYIAFAVIYRGSDLKDPFKLFVDANTGAMDIVQVVMGFSLAFALPFWLKLGERRPESRSR